MRPIIDDLMKLGFHPLEWSDRFVVLKEDVLPVRTLNFLINKWNLRSVSVVDGRLVLVFKE